MNLDDVRAHYAKVQKFIQEERQARLHVLEAFDDTPETSPPIVECDEALASLLAIGNFIKENVAKPEQATLLDAPEAKRKGGY